MSFRNISESYGDAELVASFNLEARNHKFIGSSGCGRSTTQRVIAGVEEIRDNIALGLDAVIRAPTRSIAL